MESTNIAQSQTPTSPPSSPTPGPRPVKDKKYYFDDGDCTFLVDGVLFKLHKSILSKNPDSAFRHMFQDAKEEDSDIIELGDRAEDFRSLCWIIYATPLEIVHLASRPDEVGVRKYLSVLELAHKYMLSDLETWAWNMARVKPPMVPNYLDICSPDELEHMFSLATRCQESVPDFPALVETAWLTRLKRGELSSGQALTIGEFHGRRAFQGDVYMHLRGILIAGPVLTSPALGLSHLGLTKAQEQRLLLGWTILSNHMGGLKKLLSNDVPQADPNCSNHYYDCRNKWDDIHPRYSVDQPESMFPWLAAVEKLRRSQPLSKCLRLHIDSIAPYMASSFTLADYFLGPEQALPSKSKKNKKTKAPIQTPDLVLDGI
ncbi:hypothetical protein C8F01DRAFT_1112411 [Mycena amicta]|nr:hypothetical protein C8F01DRAFT_1112411 [Mycena amicta]